MTPDWYEALPTWEREIVHDALDEWIETVNEQNPSPTGRSPQHDRKE